MCCTRLVGQANPFLLIACTDLRAVLRRRATATPRCNACIDDLALQKRCQNSTLLRRQPKSIQLRAQVKCLQAEIKPRTCPVYGCRAPPKPLRHHSSDLAPTDVHGSNSDTPSQGCTDLQSPVACPHHATHQLVGIWHVVLSLYRNFDMSVLQ